jgi:glycosyltransferase involved in cell wall biosynthesis
MTNTNQNQIDISVVIPAYNSQSHIARAIESALNQSLAPREIIVVDDGSTDKTAEVVKKYDNVTYIYQQNAGASVARNTGIDAAAANWIALLDADDEWLNDHLKLQTELIERNPQLNWTTANYTLCLCEEKRQAPSIDPSYAKSLLQGRQFFDNYFDAFNKKCGGCTITMLIKKETLIKAGMFRPGQLVANDQDLWFRIAYENTKVGFLCEPTAIYHLSVADSITKKYRQVEMLIDFVKRHLTLAKQHNMSKHLAPWAKRLITLRIRSLLFENEPKKIKQLTDEFGNLLNPAFKLLINLLMVCPALTANCCHLISKIVRKLNLRNKITPPPGLPK